MIGVDQRTTMDMDTTVRGLPVNEESINKILEEILHLPSDDEIVFSLQGLKSIREKNQYEDYCATIFADYGKIHGVLKVDITTGDAITPREVNTRTLIYLVMGKLQLWLIQLKRFWQKNTRQS